MGDTTNLYANNSNQSTGIEHNSPKDSSNKCQKTFFLVMICLLGACLILGIVLLAKYHHHIGWVVLLVSAFGMAFCHKCLCDIRNQNLSSKPTKVEKPKVVPRIFKIWYKQRCYKKINTLHSYLKSGSITQDEFQQLKNEILQSIQ